MGTSPFGTLNYYDAVRRYMSPAAVQQFLTLYMIPGVYHCAGGPAAASLDMLTPLIAWVEDGVAPGRQVISYHAGGNTSTPVTRTRPVFPYPTVAKYSGHGDVDNAADCAPAPPTAGVSDVLRWAGLDHYRPEEQLWCNAKHGRNGKNDKDDNDDDHHRGGHEHASDADGCRFDELRLQAEDGIDATRSHRRFTGGAASPSALRRQMER